MVVNVIGNYIVIMNIISVETIVIIITLPGVGTCIVIIGLAVYY